MKKKRKEKDKPGAQSPALKTVCFEVSSGSSINDHEETRVLSLLRPMEMTNFVDYFHSHESDSGEVIFLSKHLLYINDFLQGFVTLIPSTWRNECTNHAFDQVLEKSVCFTFSDNEDATDRIGHTKSNTMDQVCQSWYGYTTFSTKPGELWTVKDIKRRVYQTLWSCVSHFPEHYPCDHTRGLSLRCFTLKESIGMYRGAAPPLDFVTRILNSKYWMLEADKWVDLLIICCWANPTTFIIETKDVLCWICGNEWIDPGNTSCGHTFCTDCLREKFKNGCRKCPSCQTVVEAKVYKNDSAKVLLIRYRQERQHASEKISSEYIPVKASKRKREVDFCPHSIKKQCESACGGASLSRNENSKPDFNTIYEALYPARLKWYNIGLSLGIQYQELKVIKKENIGDCSECLRETLIIRFETETPTVNDFVKALENKTVNHKELAKKLKEQYMHENGTS